MNEAKRGESWPGGRATPPPPDTLSELVGQYIRDRRQLVPEAQQRLLAQRMADIGIAMPYRLMEKYTAARCLRVYRWLRYNMAAGRLREPRSIRAYYLAMLIREHEPIPDVPEAEYFKLCPDEP